MISPKDNSFYKQMIAICLTLTGPVFTTVTYAQTIKLVPNEAQKKVEVLVDGQPFTAYWYPGPAVLKKPVLYPIRSATGQFITRGWPVDPRPGERVDHPHHVGLWFNYGDVNGHDFWNNSNDIKDTKAIYGTIVHTGIVSMKGGKESGELTITADWLDKDNLPMLRERTAFTFRGSKTSRTIDRQTTLTALATDVVFKDNKEGLMGLRVSRELEHPATKADVFTDASGKTTAVPVLNNAGVTGHYRSSEGVEGEAVWGKRANEMTLTGTINNQPVTITMVDDPKNIGYPTYWHARGYGLFAANPLAPAVFTDKKEPAMNYTLKAGQSVTFRYLVTIK